MLCCVSSGSAPLSTTSPSWSTRTARRASPRSAIGARGRESCSCPPSTSSKSILDGPSPSPPPLPPLPPPPGPMSPGGPAEADGTKEAAVTRRADAVEAEDVAAAEAGASERAFHAALSGRSEVRADAATWWSR
eukprot:6447273-Prymnesium_polylepis.1